MSTEPTPKELSADPKSRLAKVTKVGVSLKSSRAACPYYLLIETTILVAVDEEINGILIKGTAVITKSHFVWATRPWEIAVGVELPVDQLEAVFKRKFS
jgi:hypothetical protein